MNKGKVYLIGAGPGAPGLLTCRAKQLLSECDVVCYDKLVSAAILALVPGHIPCHEVGYRGYQGCHVDYGMHPDVTAFALAGKTVARLKSGDPCIFARTTEECRDLNAHGIPYEIVPGITAALGAAAYSGFPLTSGGVASSVSFVSGHQHTSLISAWGASGQAGGTLVLYMGAKKLAGHVGQLIESGRSPETPIALISAATQTEHTCVIATLATVMEVMQRHSLTGPTLTIVGDVVAQHRELNWHSQRPLAGSRFLVCGEYAGIQALEDKGAEVICLADLPTESLLGREDLDYLVTQKALMFRDRAAFNLWKQALFDNQWDIRKFAMPMGSQSPCVREALQNLGIVPQPCPRDALTLTLDEGHGFNLQDNGPQSHAPQSHGPQGNGFQDNGSQGNASQGNDSLGNHYLVGRRRSEPLGYQLPPVHWLLAENLAVVRSIAVHQPDVLTHAVLVPLNGEVHRWALAQDGLTIESNCPALPGLSAITTVCECSDVV